MTLVSYELADRPAALVVDLVQVAAGWRIVDQEVAVAQVLSVAPPDELDRLVRRAVGEVRGHASGSASPASDNLRRLAAEIWRDYRQARAGVGGQPALPGL